MHDLLKFRIPEGICVYAIGDIHGRLDLLSALMAQITIDAARFDERKILVFLGDYIDRGESSKGVIDFLLTGLPQDMETIFLRGNHEDALLRFLEEDLMAGSRWMQFGGVAALASYGVDAHRSGGAKDLDSIRVELIDRLPETHQAFLESTRFSTIIGDYYFVHAGLRPGVPLENQTPEIMMSIRDVFLSTPYDYGKRIIHGHSISETPDVLPYRIGIDTGAYASNRLTTLRLRGSTIKFLRT